MALKTSVNIRPMKEPKRGIYFWLGTYLKGGKVCKKYFRTGDEAKAFKDEREREALTHGAAHELSPEERTAVIETREMLSEAGLSLRQAVEQAVDARRRLRLSATVETLVGEYLHRKKREGRGERHLTDLRTKLARFSASFGDRMTASVTSTEISEWLDGLDVAPPSVLAYRRVVGALFNEGVRRKYADANPVQDSIKPQVKESDIEVLTPDEAEALLVAASDSIRPFFAIGMFAGLRESEIKRLDWQDVSLTRGYIRVNALSKTGRRLVKVQPNLAAWLKPLAKAKGPVMPPAMRRLREEAWRAAGLKRWPHNALRHSFGSYHLAQWNEMGVVCEQMGNTPAVVRNHYREVVFPEDADRFWEIVPD